MKNERVLSVKSLIELKGRLSILFVDFIITNGLEHLSY